MNATPLRWIIVLSFSITIFSCSQRGRSAACHQKKGQDTTIMLYGTSADVIFYPVTENDVIRSFSYANEGAYTAFQSLKNAFSGFDSLPITSSNIVSTVLYKTESEEADSSYLNMVLLYVREHDYLRTVLLVNQENSFTIDSLFYAKSYRVSSNDLYALAVKIRSFTSKVDIVSFFSTKTGYSSRDTKAEFQRILSESTSP